MSTKREQVPRSNGHGVLQRLSPIACAVAQGVAQLSVRRRDDQDRRHQGRPVLPRRAPAAVPRRQSSSRSTLRQLPARDDSPRSCSGPSAGSRPHEVTRRRATAGVSAERRSVGQSGLEAYYDRYLRGVDGAEQVQVDALGQFDGDLPSTHADRRRHLKLSLDAQPPAGRPAGAARRRSTTNPPAQARRLRRDEPDQRRGLRDGLAPDVQPDVFTKPVPAVGLQRELEQRSRATIRCQPRDPERRPDRFDVQADHRDRGARERRVDARRHLRRHRPVLHPAPADVPPQRRRRRRTACSNLIQAIKVSSDDFFYNLGALTERRPDRPPNGGALQHWAHLFGIGRKTGIDLPAARSPGRCRRRPGGRAQQARARVRARHRPVQGQPSTARRRLRDRRRPRRGRSATTSTWPSGRATSRSRRCSSRSPTRRSPTAARSCARTSGSTSSRPTARVLQKIDPPPARHVEHQPGVPATRSGRACTRRPRSRAAPRTTCWATSPSRSTARPAPPSTSDQADYALVRLLRAATATSKPIVVVVTVEQGGFGDVAAAPVARQILSQWFFGKPGAVQGRSLDRRCEREHAAIQRPRRPRRRAPRALLRFDPLLLLAALGPGRAARWSR